MTHCQHANENMFHKFTYHQQDLNLDVISLYIKLSVILNYLLKLPFQYNQQN